MARISFNGLLLNKWFYISIGGVFIIASCVIFKWNHTIQVFDSGSLQTPTY